MERFGRVLRRADRELRVREPERSRILLELAADLEDLYREYRSRGLSEDEARCRAEAWLAPDPGALSLLRRLHTPLPGRLLASLSEVGRSRLESLVLTVLALASVAGGIGMLRATPFPWPPAPAAVVVLLLGGWGVALAGRRALDVFLSPDPTCWVPDAVPGLLTLAGASGVVGVLGACLHLHAAFGPSAPAVPTGAYVWGTVAAASATAALGIIVALTLGLLWFWLAARVSVVHAARADLREVAAFAHPETREA